MSEMSPEKDEGSRMVEARGGALCFTKNELMKSALRSGQV